MEVVLFPQLFLFGVLICVKHLHPSSFNRTILHLLYINFTFGRFFETIRAGNSGQICQACIREGMHFSSSWGTQIEVIFRAATFPQLPVTQDELSLLNIYRKKPLLLLRSMTWGNSVYPFALNVLFIFVKAYILQELMVAIPLLPKRASSSACSSRFVCTC